MECGTEEDGCGGTIDCGTCGEGQSCSEEGACVADCTPAIECTEGVDCGTEEDGCGGTIDCGTCGEGQSCSDEGICESAAASATYDAHAQPIFNAKCGACHTVAGSGGHNIGTSYEDSQLDSYSCDGTKAECAMERIASGSMPQGKGCGGVVADDAANANVCITESEYAQLGAWIADGMLEN